MALFVLVCGEGFNNPTMLYVYLTFRGEKRMSSNRNYESEDDDGDDPCAYCGHDPCCCDDDDEDED
ncbi:MAG: hypothetical protein JZU65_22865 [Chlorobium sp.]|nr:hypothetical protein [Chlorobium sp.]